MKAHFICFALCLILLSLNGQTSSDPKNKPVLHEQTDASVEVGSEKSPCAGSNPLTILSCAGETPTTGDNDPSNGAFINWSVTGGDLYHIILISSSFTYTVPNPAQAGSTVFRPNQADGTTLTDGLVTAALNTFDCLPAGNYVMRAWSVRDDNNDGRPDTDSNGEIIGCYEECSFQFFPSCANIDRFDVTVNTVPIGCNSEGGFIEIVEVDPTKFYCTTENGDGLNFRWDGPNGFTSTSREIRDLDPGIYVLQVTDQYDCSLDRVTVLPDLDNVAFACAVMTRPSTLGGNDGAVDIDIISGSGDYELSWTGAATGSTTAISNGPNTITGLPAGDYTFTLVDLGNGCFETCILTIEELSCDSPIVQLLSQRNSDCNAGPSGMLEIAVAGNFNPQVTWRGPNVNGSNLLLLENLVPGTYSYVATDDRLCTVSDTIVIDSAPAFTLQCGGIDETLPFLDDGRLTVALAGGTPPFLLNYTATDSEGNPLPTVSDLPINNPDTLADLSSGNYFLTVVDATGCTRSCTAVISEPDCEIFPNCVPENPQSIFGNGQVTLNFDGSPDWFVTVSGALDTTFITSVATVFIENLPQGDYTVDVYNSEGCVGDCTFSIIAPPCTLAGTIMSTASSCFGTDDGRIQIDITGASEGLTVDWNDDRFDGMTVVNNLEPGTYIVQLSDRTQCPVTPLQVTLTEPDSLGADLVEVMPVTCFGDADGAIRSAITGGVAPLSYNWSISAPDDVTILNNLEAGTYSLVVTDAIGCTDDAAITLTNPPRISLSCQATAETVMNNLDGTIRVAHAGARGAVRLSGSLGDFTLSTNSDTLFTGLPPGTYDLVLTDAFGCSDSCQAIVSPGPCTLDAFTTTEQPDCDRATGAATAVALNTTGTVTYAWSNGSTQSEQTDLAPGDYSVTVSDASNCQTVATARINAFTDIPQLLNSRLTPVCADDCTSLALALAGTPPFSIDYTFSVNATAPVSRSLNLTGSGVTLICPDDLGLNSLAGVTFRLASVTDGNGCARPLNVILPVTHGLPPVRQLDTVVCEGTVVSLAGEQFSTARPTGLVMLPAAAANGCDSIVQVSLTTFAPASSALPITLCPGDEFPFFGTIFNANNRTGSVVVPTPSSTGCDSTVMVFLDFHPPATGRLDTMACAGSTLNYRGQLFTETRSSGTVAIPNAARNGCDSLVDVSVSFYASPQYVFDTVVCPGSQFTFQNTLFNDNRRIAEVILPGAAAFGCDSSILVRAFYQTSFPGQLDTTICAGTSFTKDGITFDRQVQRVPVLVDEPTVDGCDSIVLVTVNTRPRPRITLSGSGVICSGGRVDIQLSHVGVDTARLVLSTDPLDTITLPVGRSIISRRLPLGTEVTILSVSGGGPCPPLFGGSLIVRETDLAVDISVTDNRRLLDCSNSADGSLTANATGGEAPYAYNWSDGRRSQTLDSLTQGLYQVIVVSAAGCLAQDTASLFAPPPLLLEATPAPRNCLDSLPGIFVRGISGGSAPYLFRTELSNGFQMLGTPSERITLPEGEGLVEVEDLNGCRLDTVFTFDPFPEPQLSIAPPRTVISRGDSALINITTTLNATSYRLSPGADSVLAPADFYVSPRINTFYTLRAVDSLGCSVSGRFEVLLDDFVPIYAPNVFTPNEDGSNDRFRLYAPNTAILFKRFEVFTRWGELVYQLANPVGPDNERWGWDGKNQNGTIHVQDVFVFKAEVELEDGRLIELTGDMLLMR